MKDATRILIRPLITEKGTMLREKNNQVLFEVDKDANKIEIKQAIEDLFKVHVEDVKTTLLKGKNKRYGRHLYTRQDKKKAIVTLKEGESIAIYEGV